jgi:hypothetical protein
MVIWTKGHLTESSYNWKVFSKNAKNAHEFLVKQDFVPSFFFGQMTFFVESRLGQMIIFWKLIGHMTFG